MAMRPAMAALGCYACRNAVLKAVLGGAAPGIRTFATQSPHRLQGAARPFLDSRRQHSTRVEAGESTVIAEEETSGQGEDNAKSQWFLEVEPPRHAPSLHKPTLPTIPEDAPTLFEPMMKYIYEDMGLDDLAFLDLRDLDPPAALGPNLIMLFGTARSERHLHIASGRFVRWLRRNYKVDAKADGLIGAGELKTKLRRLRKKAKLMGTNTMIIPGGDNGLSTGWVCVNFSAEEGATGEAVSYDESGRFSGFGSCQTGTTIVIQCMTESRRNELDLETLWQETLRHSLEQGKKIRGEGLSDPGELDRLVTSRVQLAPGSVAAQWNGFVKAAQQQRPFSTSARRLRAQIPNLVGQPYETPIADIMPRSSMLDSTHSPSAEVFRQRIDAVLHRGMRTSLETVENTITDVLRTDAPIPASERLALVDDILRNSHERGMAIDSGRMLIMMLTSIVISPAYDEDMARAQKNLELLLTERQAIRFAQSGAAIPEDLTVALMSAYAQRKQWNRFWDTFRSRARFLRPRSTIVYECVFRSILASRDSKFCRENLGWVYAGMVFEEPYVPVIGSLYESLKACILLADRNAEEMLHGALGADLLDGEKKRVMRREFIRLLKEVEGKRDLHAGMEAREHEASPVEAEPAKASAEDPEQQTISEEQQVEASKQLQAALQAQRRP
ncbi:hypothetical protein HIM_02986 [Hirsutella minnesotensis 3608]|nr:hypothetical protein HIM_02986 [Hirsutella minnesotensis 3608]